MDLIEAKIAEIKNLNLIYIFTTDSILRNKSEKYVGAKVVYNKDEVITLDYKNPHFSDFIKKILSRYNKEKEKRNIVLLGDLTKKLVQDSFFALIEEKKEFKQHSGILVNFKKNRVKGYQKYLEKALKTILKSISNYDYVKINSIDGFNYKYVVNYSIGNINKDLSMLIFINDDNLDFKISNIDGKNVNINGNIKCNFNNLEVNWYDDISKLKSNVVYNAKECVVTEKMYKDEDIIISKEYEDTLLDEDEKLISFYSKLCGLDELKNIMKIDDNCYVLTNADIIGNEKEGIIYSDKSCMISIFEDEVIINQRDKCGISKYNDQINAVLEEKISEFTIKRIQIENDYYLLIENKTNDNGNISYNYNVLKLNKDENLFLPFEISEKHVIEEELKSLDYAKQYIKRLEGGK